MIHDITDCLIFNLVLLIIKLSRIVIWLVINFDNVCSDSKLPCKDTPGEDIKVSFTLRYVI
jgi:hypothetical protein